MPVSAVFSTTDNGSFEELIDTVKEACTMEAFKSALALAAGDSGLSSLDWTGAAELLAVAETGVAIILLLIEHAGIIGRI